MRQLIPTFLVIGWLFSSGYQAWAQQGDGVQVIPTATGYNLPYQRGCSLRHLFQWLTYRPLPTPRECQCRKVEMTSLPPVYTYFIGAYGPRSPGLGYPTNGREFVSPSNGYGSRGIGSPGHGYVVTADPPATPQVVIPQGREVPVHDATPGPAPAESSRIEVVVPAETQQEIPVHAAPVSQEISVHGAAEGLEIQIQEATPRNVVPIRDVTVPVNTTGN